MRNEKGIRGESFASPRRFFNPLILLALLVSGEWVQAQSAPFKDVCPAAGSGLLVSYDNNKKEETQLPRDRTFDKDWQRDYPMLIFSMLGVVESLKLQKAATDAEAAKQVAQTNLDNAKVADRNQLQTLLDTAKTNQEKAKKALEEFKSPTNGGQLFWKESNNDALIPLNNPVFVPRVYTTEKLLVLVCNAKFGDSSDVSDVAVTVNVGDSGPESLRPAPIKIDRTLDRVYVLDPSKTSNNSIERVLITLKPDGAPSADTLATALIERHKVIHYSAGGGVLLIRGTQNTYSNITVPSVLTTTTSVNTTVTTNGVVTGTTTSSTTATAAGSFTNVFGQASSSIQITDVAGATWYPLGRDTYPVSRGHGLAVSYSTFDPLRSLGLFLGTSVSSLGNFTVGPTYEPFAGIQLFAGATWWNKNTLLPNVTACSGYGQSASFTVPPASTNTSSTSVTASGITTVTTTVTTIATSATSGCANGDKATIVTGTTPPTQSNLKPAFSFGIMFNTNLFKSFSGLK
jgi:hypothetical protein